MCFVIGRDAVRPSHVVGDIGVEFSVIKPPQNKPTLLPLLTGATLGIIAHWRGRKRQPCKYGKYERVEFSAVRNNPCRQVQILPPQPLLL